MSALRQKFALTGVALWAAAVGIGVAGEGIEFNRDIKPILAENCYFCHGPDAGDRKADLRLDTFDGATAKRNGGEVAVVPGKPGESELVHRVFSDDPDERMPPPEAKISLTSREKELLRQWIASGAEYRRHWAFVAPQKVALQGEGHPIDQLVARKLAKQNLELGPQAARELLLRRVCLDLTGLPPTLEQREQFMNDDRPGAYERLVDRLLASPAYGERMAWDWLDAARYADTNGYQGDNERTMWPWRDWVAEAFNKNLPYDKFTIWQLAGDLLPDASDETRLATGFSRNHPINGEGGRIAEENRVDYVMDMTETMGTVWLGLTLNCCRCHDHKFDPLAQKDYYRFTAYFNQTPVDGGGRSGQTPPVISVVPESQRQEIAKLSGEIEALDRQIAGRRDQLRQQHERDESEGSWKKLTPERASALSQRLEIQVGGRVLARGDNPANDTYTIVADPEIDVIAGLRLDALRHEAMTGGGLARSDSGNFVLTGVEVAVLRGGEAEPVRIASAEASFVQGGWNIAGTYDGKKDTGWAVYEGRTVDREHSALWRFDAPVKLGKGDKLRIVLRHDSQHVKHNLGYFRLAVSSDSKAPLKFDPVAQDAKLGELTLARDELVKRREEIEKRAPKVMIMQDMAKRRKTYVLETGLYNKRGAEVDPGVPAALPAMPDGYPDNRLGLARWLVDPANPLTARVTVNRFWQQVFGIGLVKTAEDFGTQGETPPHIELLDWLAVDFRENGWDVKRLMKQMVTSAAYRQTAKSTSGYREDPENRRLARGPRFRMPSWMLRDQALAASGLLVRQIGGEPVNPYQPAGIWEETSFGKKKYNRGSGDDLYRRSLYTFWRRIAPPTAFFDNAGRQVCQVNPVRTNTPLHALYTLNEITFVEAARVLAEQAIKRYPADRAARSEFFYLRILARRPSAEELVLLHDVLDKTIERFKAGPGEASAFLSVGESVRDEKLDAVEHASWTALCLAIFNLDEAVTKP